MFLIEKIYFNKNTLYLKTKKLMVENRFYKLFPYNFWAMSKILNYNVYFFNSKEAIDS